MKVQSLRKDLDSLQYLKEDVYPKKAFLIFPILLFLFLVFTNKGNSQNRNSIWCFGDSAGIDFSGPTPVPISSGMDGRGSCASIADSNGNLLFYAYTYASLLRTEIRDANNDTMLNSTLMIGGSLYHELTIVPVPDSSSLYYLFYTGDPGHIDSTFYALIDMRLNGGLGEVASKNISIAGYRPADCILAIKHGNGRDWWLIGKHSDYINGTTLNRYYTYLITPDSIYAPQVQDFNNATDLDFQKMVFNSDGSKLMQINVRGLMCEYDFDRCNGIISNPRIIYPELTSNFSRIFYEGAYSPSDSLFYVSMSTGINCTDTQRLLQYNLLSPNISASCDTIETYSCPAAFGAVRLAPDDKIYFSRAYQSPSAGSFPYPDSMRNSINENLSVINNPNVDGTGCNYTPFSFYLGGKRTYYGLPNNPKYSLGPVLGSVCDSLGLGIDEIKKENFVSVFPNPFNDKINIRFLNQGSEKLKLRLYDITGREIFYKEMKPIDQELNLNTLSKGIYILHIEGREHIFKRKILKID